jgi:hypothetical protein
VIFKPVTREEYERMTLEQRMDYLQRLMTDISAKLEENRQRVKRINAEMQGKE